MAKPSSPNKGRRSKERSTDRSKGKSTGRSKDSSTSRNRSTASKRSTQQGARAKPERNCQGTEPRSTASRSSEPSRRNSEHKKNSSADTRRTQTTLHDKTSEFKKDSEPVKQDHTKPYFVEVDEERAGQRLDNFLITLLKGVPKTRIYRIIRKGEVRINKSRAKQTTRLEQGDSIRIPPIRQADKNAPVEATKFTFLNKTVLYEDDALLVINKPSGMAVHAGSGIKVGVIEALRALRTDLSYLELVHRLDRETSGCLILAKKASALKQLNQDMTISSLKNARIDKRYLTLLKGHWQFGKKRITKPLNTQAMRHGQRIVVVDEKGVYASSIFTPVDVGQQASLLQVKLLTGRTHQVRVHALSENHPVVGDATYGDQAFNQMMKQHGLKRLFLHASRITIYHPVSGDSLQISAPLPEELTNVLDSLGLCIS